MDNQNKIRLCGGTFLVLLFEAKGQRRASRARNGRPSDKKSNPEIFGSLVKFTNPDFVMPDGRTFATFTSDYKLCRKSDSPVAMLTDDEIIRSFDYAICNSYTSNLQKFSQFLSDSISLNAKGTWLVAALIDMIVSDESIPDNAEFYIQPDGKPIIKAGLKKEDRYSVTAFLLGVWHYIIVNITDNKIGIDSLDLLLSTPSEKRAERKFNSEIGKSTASKIHTHIDISENYIDSTEFIATKNNASKISKPSKIKISYRSIQLTQEMEQTFLSWNPAVIDLDLNHNAYLLISNRNAKFILSNNCKMNFEMGPDFTLQVKISFTIEDTNFSGFTSSDNWDSKSYVNNLVSVGNYDCIAWFKIINPTDANPQVQFLMIGEPDE